MCGSIDQRIKHHQRIWCLFQKANRAYATTSSPMHTTLLVKKEVGIMQAEFGGRYNVKGVWKLLLDVSKSHRSLRPSLPFNLPLCHSPTPLLPPSLPPSSISTYPSVVFPPPHDVLVWVRPQQVAQEPRIWHVGGAHDVLYFL